MAAYSEWQSHLFNSSWIIAGIGFPEEPFDFTLLTIIFNGMRYAQKKPP